MILGASTYQVPLIRTARRMGLYTIVVSIPGDYPGFALADKIYELNTRDKEAILAAAEKEQIDGICTSGTDVAVSTIGYVCEKMHLSGIPYEAAEILTDKAKMKDAFRQGGVSAADGMRVRSAEEAQKAAEQLGYPVVVKRVDSSGSRGITVVEHSGQIEEAYENARNGSARDYVLVEKFLRGTEIGVDGFVQNHNWSFWHRTRNLYTAVHTRPFRSATHFRMDAAGHCGKKLPARCSWPSPHPVPISAPSMRMSLWTERRSGSLKWAEEPEQPAFRN